ncbi:CBS domain-containing protein [archaeon]|nr:MAG: CBS domain-containing protein [archaeon]RLG66036.1 MAG: CBS domain-containing protein [archaeon]HDM23788.1 CBS domain-containing protein [Candidatus Bathyarchaeota archaeon]
MGEEYTLKVKNIMSENLITAPQTADIVELSKLMTKHNIGSVIIVSEETGDPIGIVTERDIITRALSKGLPLSTKAEKIMSTPLITIDEEASIREALDLMNRHGTKRLLVKNAQGKIVGILTMTDVQKVMPALMEILSYKAPTEVVEKAEAAYSGFCDECGSWSSELRRVDDRFLCPECYLAFSGEESE